METLASFADKTMEPAALVLFHRRPPEDREWLLMTNTQPRDPAPAPHSKVVFSQVSLNQNMFELGGFLEGALICFSSFISLGS